MIKLKLLNVEQIENMNIEDVIQAYKEGYTLENRMNTMAYTDLDSKTCISTVAAVAPITSGLLTITTCPQGSAVGSTVTVGATVTNTGNMHNNSFVILCAIARADNGAAITNNNSGNMTLAPGATSSEYRLSFTMPAVNVNILFKAQADPLFNY